MPSRELEDRIHDIHLAAYDFDTGKFAIGQADLATLDLVQGEVKAAYKRGRKDAEKGHQEFMNVLGAKLDDGIKEIDQAIAQYLTKKENQ